MAIGQSRDPIHFDEEGENYIVGLQWRYGQDKSAQVLNAIDSCAMAERRLRSMTPCLQKEYLPK